MSSPLRGGLSVFGAGPGLDRCASKERYLAEKLVQFSDASVGGVVSLSSLAGVVLSAARTPLFSPRPCSPMSDVVHALLLPQRP